MRWRLRWRRWPCCLFHASYPSILRRDRPIAMEHHERIVSGKKETSCHSISSWEKQYRLHRAGMIFMSTFPPFFHSDEFIWGLATKSSCHRVVADFQRSLPKLTDSHRDQSSFRAIRQGTFVIQQQKSAVSRFVLSSGVERGALNSPARKSFEKCISGKKKNEVKKKKLVIFVTARQGRYYPCASSGVPAVVVAVAVEREKENKDEPQSIN